MEKLIIDQVIYNWYVDPYGAPICSIYTVGYGGVVEIEAFDPRLYRVKFENGSMIDILNANTVSWTTVGEPTAKVPDQSFEPDKLPF